MSCLLHCLTSKDLSRQVLILLFAHHYLVQFRPRNFVKVDSAPSQNEAATEINAPQVPSTLKVEADAIKGKGSIARHPRNSLPVAQQVVFGGTVGAGASLARKQGPLQGNSNQIAGSTVRQQANAQQNATPRSSAAPESHQRGNKGRTSHRVIGDTSDSSTSDTDTSMDMETSFDDQDEGYPFMQLHPEIETPQQYGDFGDETEQEFKSLMQELGMLSSTADTDTNEDLMLFQLPSVLPIAAMVKEDDSAGEQCESRPSRLRDLPSMKIGKLLVLQSGAVKMQIGDVLFDVTPSIPCKMRQEAAIVDLNNKECTMLGHITQRVVVTPDVEHLLTNDCMAGTEVAGVKGGALTSSDTPSLKRGHRRKR